ncbi:polysaccharide deacetylase family protein [Bacillus shivajii]|uniref:polysaccharide deacetylase family protein n=1 Tax=Bacillus shivajii TaxID=1983719 RepID=UPI001CF99C17|nr:polysaccharide deacetylase family protein [Bacillus shivajii]UCZ55177.1 polysaccharide deacetylase family protein [Bacillus shivajii]
MMKNKGQYFMLFIFICAILFSSAGNALARESQVSEADINVDDLDVNTEYLLREGHLMVPALFFKNTGAKVNWNDRYQSIVFQVGDKKVAAPVGKTFTDIFNPNTRQWERGELSVEPISVNGQTFVPLRDIALELGFHVSYRPDLKKTVINTNIERKAKRIRTGNTSQKYVSLTFDDGPDPIYTPQILDILKEKNVKATFFVVGKQIDKHPEMMQRIVNEGHSLGNHTLSHPRLPNETTAEVSREIQLTQDKIAESVGRRPDLFRPPFGLLTRADEQLLHEYGLRIIIWSVDTLDYTGLSADHILEIVERDISPGGIVLQHNIDLNPGLLDGTVEALPEIIDRLRQEGYSFLTVQSLLDQNQ